VLGEVELALNAYDVAGSLFLCHNVNSNITNIPLSRPFIPKPDTGKALGVLRVELEVTAN
jgi:hypothetical protein